MLKQFVLLLLVTINANLNGGRSPSDFLDFTLEWHLTHVGDVLPHISPCIIPSKDAVDAVLRDPKVLKLFEAADRLLSVLPGKKPDGKCLCYNKGKDDTIKLRCLSGIGGHCILTPWTKYSIEIISDLRKGCEIVRRNGLEFTEEKFMGSLVAIEITALEGESLPKISYSALERCTMFAAWQQYQSPEERAVRERWSPAKRAWVGSVVRASNARKPVGVVAAELKE